jgi:cell shape-determining protein MreD
MVTLSLILQDFSPPIAMAYQGYFHFFAVVYFGCALALPFPVMLLLAFFTGFLWDSKNMTFFADADVILAGQNIGTVVSKGGSTFGFSIFMLALLGALFQGIRPLFRRGHWTLPILFAGLGTFLLLLLEYLWINFRRGGFSFSRDIWFHILTTALLSMLISPAIFYAIDRMAALCGFQIRHDGLTQRRWSS